MNQLLAALVLGMLTTTVGCFTGAQVEKGGGERVVLEQVNERNTGRIDVEGHVVNTGGSKAEDVVLSFKFFDAGVLFLEGKIRVGDILAGDLATFSGSFSGSPVQGVFTWEYRIDWD